LKRSEDLLKAVLSKLGKEVVQNFRVWYDEKQRQGSDWDEEATHGVKGVKGKLGGVAGKIEEVKEKLEGVKDKIEDVLGIRHKDEFNKFENWGETVTETYEQIYYPTIELSRKSHY
jgi:hypothetical protein